MKLAHDWVLQDLPPNVILGPRSWLYSAYAFLHYRSRADVGVSIGSDSGIYHGTFFELGEHGRVTIGNFCTLVGPKIITDGSVVIGNYSLIAHDVVIADHAYAVPPASPQSVGTSNRQSTIFIGEKVWIGAGAILLGGAHVGENSIVAAAALVNFEVPPNSIIAGNPGRIAGSVSPKWQVP